MEKLDIAIFKAGKHVDSSGRGREWTLDDLDSIVSKYNDQGVNDRHDAPVVLGHPETDSPAYGWVEKLYRKGDTLFATLKELSPEFLGMLKQGKSKKRSVSIFPDLMLRHVGFLGATPPAVWGLKDPDLSKYSSDNEYIVYEYANTNDSLIDSVDEIDNSEDTKRTKSKKILNSKFNKMEKKMDVNSKNPIAKFIETVALNIKEQLGEEIAQEVITIIEKYKSLLVIDNTKKEETDDKAVDAKHSAFNESVEYKEMLEKIAMSDAKIKQLETENIRKDNESYFNKQREEGQLLPRQKEIVMQTLTFASAFNGTIDFNKQEKTMNDMVKDLIGSFNKQVNLSEFAKNNETHYQMGSDAQQNDVELKKIVEDYNNKGRI